MLVRVLLAFLLAFLTGVEGNLGEGGDKAGFLGAEAGEGAAEGKHLVHGLRTAGDAGVALAQQDEAVGEADLAFLDAVRGGGEQGLAGAATGMAGVVVVSCSAARLWVLRAARVARPAVWRRVRRSMEVS